MQRWMWIAAVMFAGCAHESGKTHSSNYQQPEATVTSLEVVRSDNFFDRQAVSGGLPVLVLEVRDSSGQAWQVRDRAFVQHLQQRLADQGCDPGRTDGKLDSRLKEAVRQCQQRMNLPQTGTIDQQTARELGFELTVVRQSTKL